MKAGSDGLGRSNGLECLGRALLAHFGGSDGQRTEARGIVIGRQHRIGRMRDPLSDRWIVGQRHSRPIRQLFCKWRTSPHGHPSARAGLRAFPGEERVPRDPVEGVDPLPQLRRVGRRRSVRLDLQGGGSDVEGRATDVPDVGVEFGGHPPGRNDEQEAGGTRRL